MQIGWQLESRQPGMNKDCSATAKLAHEHPELKEDIVADGRSPLFPAFNQILELSDGDAKIRRIDCVF